MTGITVLDIARLTGGRLHGDGSAEVSSLEIDSRRVRNGSLFAALPGERTDGHDYIPLAFDMGAPACLALRVPAGESRPIVVVPDVSEALRRLAREYRQTLKIPVIGITGSVGKTTAKEMVACVLEKRMSVLKTEKNFNNDLGVPLTLCRINSSHSAAVVEMGISDFGEMDTLAQMVRPTMAVYTVIGHSHLEKLHNLDGVLRAKTEMLPYLPENGVIFVNGDDELLNALEFHGKKVTFGLCGHNDVRAVNIENSGSSAITCDILARGRSIHITIPAYGRHMVYAALAAAAVGMEMGLTDEELASGIASYEPVGRRAKLLNTGTVTLIDDCYNANPDSVRCAVDSMADAKTRRVCILGDMLELGENTAALHYGVGAYAAANGVELILTAGSLAENITAGAKAAGAQGEHFSTTGELIAALPRLIKKGDTVLVKASHSMHFEDVSEAVKALFPGESA